VEKIANGICLWLRIQTRKMQDLMQANLKMN